jgi:site-specific recombinase XerD
MLVPLEQLVLPTHLDGSSGHYRDVHTNYLSAHNDIEAVQQFLNEYASSEATYRSYKKEVERLVLWAVVEKKKPLSSLTREDFSLYSEFLKDPQPHERWCGPKRGRKGARFTEGWRPFVGPLSTSAHRTALAIINSLLNYLVQARYLTGNPLGLMRQRHKVDERVRGHKYQVMQRVFDHAQWEALLETIEQLPQNTDTQKNHHQRIRYIVNVLHFLALRVGELSSHHMRDFVLIRGQWKFLVTGKGGKQADIPVHSDLLSALQQYRTWNHLPPLPSPQEDTPLVLNSSGNKSITDRRINQLLKQLVQQAATLLSHKDPHKALMMQRASAHWFRHTSITRQAEEGIPLPHIKANARHSSLNTTMLYIHTEDQERHVLIEKLSWRKPT